MGVDWISQHRLAWNTKLREHDKEIKLVKAVSSCRSDWGSLPINAISHLLQFLEEKNWIARLGPKCRLINRHWCHCVSAHVLVLKPHRSRHATFEDVEKAVKSRFRNVRELDLNGCVAAAEIQAAVAQESGQRMITKLGPPVQKGRRDIGLFPFGWWCPKLSHLSASCRIMPSLVRGVSSLPCLSSLVLKNTNFDEACTLLRHCTSISRLKFDLCWCVPGGERAMDQWVNKELKCLSLLDCRGLGDEILECLSNCCSITSLELSSKRITEGGVNHLTHLSRLQKLKLKVTRTNLGFLRDLTKLTDLSLQACVSNDRNLARLSHCHNLRKLRLDCYMPITDTVVHYLGKLTSLESLEVSRYFRHDQMSYGWDDLAQLRNLRRLCLTSWPILSWYTCDWAFLKHLPRIEVLDLRGTNFGDAKGSIALLAQLGNLQELSLGPFVTNYGIEQIQRLSKLRVLRLHSCCACTGQGMKSIASFPSLASLSLRACGNIGDDGMYFIAQNASTVELDVRGCHRLTSAGFDKLADLPFLSKICVSEQQAREVNSSNLRGAIPTLLVEVD